MGTHSFRRRIAALALLSFFGAACAPRNLTKSKTETPGAAAEKPAVKPDTLNAPGVEATEASLRGSEFVSTAVLSAVYFDYDNASLKESALDALKKNAEYLKERLELEVLVAGFCDERGTIEYNLALGQKRAKEVRDYYLRLGVAASSVATISYGKEAPVCAEHAEDCWAKNRRAETRIRTRTASAPAPSKNAE